MSDGSPDLSYAMRRLYHAARPPLDITRPPDGLRVERDVAVTARDGTTLRVNVFRPEGEGRYPVLMCAHPYGKDNLPRRMPFGYLKPLTYRIMHLNEPTRFSGYTGWESPDPGFWVPRGYVLVNCDLRGFFASDGEAELFTEAEGEGYYDLIEWAAVQPWSNGRVGLNGVSYLALSQWRVAALRPPHLAAICPWEGFSDIYRDFAYPGGVREDGFLPIWSRGVGRQPRCRTHLREEQVARPLCDAWWADRSAPLERIEVPALVCGSFSDQNLHTRGSFEGFRRISSRHRWLYTHRGGKWATYYSPEALAFQARFFDCFLKGEDNGMREVPPVRLEVREEGDRVYEVRAEEAWPLPSTRWTPLYLHAEGALSESRAPSAAVSFDTARGHARFVWRFEEDTELTGPMKLRLHVEARGADDLCIFAAVRKLRGDHHVTFEGSYGFGFDVVAHGWLKTSHRRLDEATSEPWRPWHTHDVREPLAPGQIAALEIELLPSSTLFRAGEALRLDIQGRWFFSRNPLFGHFPTRYEASPEAEAVLHLGGDHDAHLLVPVIPTSRS